MDQTVSTPLHERIRTASATHHQQLEKKVVGHLRQIACNEDYAAVLNYFYNYFSRLEQKIGGHLPVALLPDYDRRRKSAALKQDIATLDGTVTDMPGVTLPTIDSPPAALAALYVMEGSTLGGQHIVKILEHKGITEGTSFFNGYGADTHRMWNTFLQALNNAVQAEAEQELVIKTVQDTFEHFSALVDAPVVTEEV